MLANFLTDCTVRAEFVSEGWYLGSHSLAIQNLLLPSEEEAQLLAEIEPHMKRRRWEEAHWDQQIHLYREREQRRFGTIQHLTESRHRHLRQFPNKLSQ
jgi:hypothetical protein